MAFQSNVSKFGSPKGPSQIRNVPLSGIKPRVAVTDDSLHDTSQMNLFSQSCPVPSAFQRITVPVRPNIKPIAAPAKLPPLLALPTAKQEYDLVMDVWQAPAVKGGKSFYSSSVPAHLSAQGGLMMRMQMDEINNSNSSSGGHLFGINQTPPLSSPEAPIMLSCTPSSTIFNFMSGGGNSFEPRKEQQHVFGSFKHNFGAGSLLGANLSRMRLRQSISEEPIDFDDDDEEYNSKPKRGNRPSRGNVGRGLGMDIGDEPLQFTADSDDEF